MNLVDTSGWLEYFAESENSVHFESAIQDVSKLIVPVIVLYEVFKKIVADYDENRALVAIGHMKLGKVVEISEDIAIYAAKISLEKKLPMADSLIYATATRYNAIVYTQDEHFLKLPSVKYFKKS
jgi:toxin FitB